jgi:hypothetical protein
MERRTFIHIRFPAADALLTVLERNLSNVRQRADSSSVLLQYRDWAPACF